MVTMFAERQNVVLHGQHGDDGSLPGRGQRGDPEPGVTGDLHSLDDAVKLQSSIKVDHIGQKSKIENFNCETFRFETTTQCSSLEISNK